MDGNFRVVVGMMQRDEDARLEAWILYHAYLFGFDSLYIFDNGSTSPVTVAALQKYMARGVHVNFQHTGTAGFHKKGLLMTQAFQELEADPRNQFFIPLDCDEFLVLHDSDGNLLAERAHILEYLKSLLGNPHILVTLSAYANILGRPGHFFPAYDHHKVFFTEGCVRSMGEGFHRAQSRKLNEEFNTSFALLHFHYRPHTEMVLHSTRKLAHFMDVSDPQAVAAYTGTGNHVAQYVSMPQDRYDAMFEHKRGIHLPWFVPHCRNLGIGEEFLSTI
jgi:hypothetical protein